MDNLKLTTTWDLAQYFYESIEDKQLIKDIELIIPVTREFVTHYKGKIKDFGPEEFITFFADQDKLYAALNKSANYIFFQKSLNSQDQKILKLNSKIDQIYVEFGNELVFIEQELKQIGHDTLMQLSTDKILSAYAHYFVQAAQGIRYVLDGATEKALSLKSIGGVMAFNDLYDEYTGSFVYIVRADGQSQEMTESQVRSMRVSPNQAKREYAWKLIREKYNQKENRIVLSNTYKAIVKTWVSDLTIRGYQSPISIRNTEEQQADTVIQTLLDSVQKGYKLNQRYARIKAKLLGQKKLKMTDILAPLRTAEEKIEYNQAAAIVLDALQDFDQEFYDYAADMMTQGRVDVYPKKGKQGGAFAAYEDKMESFVMLNYTNNINDVLTLAHELGHAIHGHLRQIQPSQVQSEPLSLSETASVFLENLVARKILSTLDSKEAKRNFLESYCSEIASTIFRQVQYVLFEIRVHDALSRGQDLSYVDLNTLWREEQIKLWGDTVEFDVPAEEESGWSAISHIFHSPFYCYTYAFGNLLAFSLLAKYESEGSSFVPKYKQILASGGSKTPLNLLAEVGIDLNSSQFYESGLAVFAKMLDELEELSEG